MVSSSLQRTVVPSSQVLRFLRAQNNGVAYFTPSCAAVGAGKSRTEHSTHCKSTVLVARSKSSRAYATLSSAWLTEEDACTTQPIRRRREPYSSHSSTALESSTSFGSKLDFIPDKCYNRFWSPRRPSQCSTDQGPSEPDHLLFQSPRYATHFNHSERGVSSFRPARQSQYNLHSTRSVSTSSNHEKDHRLLRRFWPRGHGQSKASLEPDDLPPFSAMDDSASLGRLLRPANELRLRCTEFDENGNVTVNNGEFKKSELIAKYGLLPRDLRKIDSSLLPNILVRPSAILVNLLQLRVLIKSNRVLVFDAYGSTNSYSQSLFMYDLENKLRSPSLTSPATHLAQALPYEFRALEAVLISVTSGLESEFDGVREPVVRVLRELEEDIDRDTLRHLLIYSKKLGTFEQKARLVRDAIDDLLEADDDLADLYLTEKAQGIERPDEDDHTEVEMLLESYHKVCDEIVQAAGNLVSNIKNTEEITRAILDANRNSLMLLDLKFSIGTLGLGAGTFGAALYGMNLKNFIEESDLGFWGVSAWCSVFTVAVCIYGLRKLRRVQRISMWGGEKGDDVRGKTGWASLGGVAGERPMELEPLIGRGGEGSAEKFKRARHGYGVAATTVAANTAAKVASRHAAGHWGQAHAQSSSKDGASSASYDGGHGQGSTAEAWSGNGSASIPSGASSSVLGINDHVDHPYSNNNKNNSNHGTTSGKKSWRDIISDTKRSPGGSAAGTTEPNHQQHDFNPHQNQNQWRGLERQRSNTDNSGSGKDRDQYRDFSNTGSGDRDVEHGEQHNPMLGQEQVFQRELPRERERDRYRERDGNGHAFSVGVKGAFRGV